MFSLLHLFWRISSPLSENAAFAAQKRACLSKFACRTHFSIPQYDIHEKVKTLLSHHITFWNDCKDKPISVLFRKIL
jgi:hypothetical protein